MEITDLNKPLLKQIIQTSEGFPTPRADVTARVGTDDAGIPSVSSKPVGHPVSSHVRGADAIAGKTKFCSTDDQVEALWLLLNTPDGVRALRALNPGVRQSVDCNLSRLFPVQATVPGRGAVTFTTADQSGIGVRVTRCVAVLEGRQRGPRQYLHVHTCYPKLTESQIAQMAARKPAR